MDRPDDAPTVEAATEHELAYLLDADAVAAAFASGTHAVVPARAFHAVDLRYVDPAGSPLEYQLLLGEVWTDWAPVVPIDDEPVHRGAVIEAPSAAFALRLRGGNALEFARFEFIAERAPEGTPGFDDDPHGAESHQDEAISLSAAVEEKIARQGRWALPPATRSAGEARAIPYTGAPSWSGGRNCTGGLTAGARALGEYVVANFRGARSFEGYACRQIRGSSGMSVHGTGRALDIFVPLSGGAADNDLGDPIANWLVEHASEIGVQLIIWDRTIWSGSRSPRDRQYTGEHPHHDHLHVELTPAASRRETPFFTGGGTPPPDDGGGAGGGQAGCDSATLGRQVAHGTCVQTSYERCGGTCQWSRCDDGGWTCAADRGDCGEQIGHAACGAAPARRGCTSRSVGEEVPDGDCVQMDYDACGGTCQWARCDDGGWTCMGGGTCDGAPHAAAACDAAPAPPADPPPAASGAACSSRTLGRSVPDGDRVQMAYDACGGTCRWAVCDDGDWICRQEAGPGADHGHVQCQAAPAGDTCYSRTLGRSVPHGDRVQMSYAACQDNRRCNWAVCDDGEFRCSTEAGTGADHPHRSCQ
ncbi:MAG: hypothetical protein R3F60_05465 [bacterium]